MIDNPWLSQAAEWVGTCNGVAIACHYCADVTKARWQRLYQGYLDLIFVQWEEMETHCPSSCSHPLQLLECESVSVQDRWTKNGLNKYVTCGSGNCVFLLYCDIWQSKISSNCLEKKLFYLFWLITINSGVETNCGSQQDFLLLCL